jgi:hypothetical protein
MRLCLKNKHTKNQFVSKSKNKRRGLAERLPSKSEIPSSKSSIIKKREREKKKEDREWYLQRRILKEDSAGGGRTALNR